MKAEIAGLQLGIEQASVGIAALAVIVVAVLLFLMWRASRQLLEPPRVERDHHAAGSRVVRMQDVQRKVARG
jgi:hypothetical protein